MSTNQWRHAFYPEVESGSNTPYSSSSTSNPSSHMSTSRRSSAESTWGVNSVVGNIDHISSLERNFCSNYNCCGLRLADLHELVEHFEKSHIPHEPPIYPTHLPQNMPTSPGNSDTSPASPTLSNTSSLSSAASPSPISPTDSSTTIPLPLPTTINPLSTPYSGLVLGYPQPKPFASTIPPPVTVTDAISLSAISSPPQFPNICTPPPFLGHGVGHHDYVGSGYDFGNENDNAFTFQPTSHVYPNLNLNMYGYGYGYEYEYGEDYSGGPGGCDLDLSYPYVDVDVDVDMSGGGIQNVQTKNNDGYYESRSSSPLNSLPSLSSPSSSSSSSSYTIPAPSTPPPTDPIRNISLSPNSLLHQPGKKRWDKGGKGYGLAREIQGKGGVGRGRGRGTRRVGSVTASVAPPKRREKAYRCPHPGCTKSYLNPNGLKYHVEKGTCKIEGPEEPALSMSVPNSGSGSLPITIPIGADEYPSTLTSTSVSPDQEQDSDGRSQPSYSHGDAEGTDEPSIFRRVQDHCGDGDGVRVGVCGDAMAISDVVCGSDHGGTGIGDDYLPIQSYGMPPAESFASPHLV